MPAPFLLLASMSLAQLGNALATGVFDELGPFGAAWLRLVFAALVLLVLVRPRPWTYTPQQRKAAFGLGVATAVVTVAFAGAIDRLPLGTASALEFLGPLGVAIATRAPGRAGLLLPLVAAAGVLCLTRPWTGATDGLGVAFALVAAGAWAAYIIGSQRVGASLPGFTGLAVSFAVAALVATPVGLADAAGGFTLEPVVIIAGIAVLVPLAPFALEYLALRRMATAVFGILMCLEPGIGLLIGFVALDQVPGMLGVVGVLLVVAAGVGAQRGPSRRRASRAARPAPPTPA